VVWSLPQIAPGFGVFTSRHSEQDKSRCDTMIALAMPSKEDADKMYQLIRSQFVAVKALRCSRRLHRPRFCSKRIDLHGPPRRIAA
jgi:hypothetical protein